MHLLCHFRGWDKVASLRDQVAWDQGMEAIPSPRQIECSRISLAMSPRSHMPYLYLYDEWFVYILSLLIVRLVYIRVRVVCRRRWSERVSRDNLS